MPIDIEKFNSEVEQFNKKYDLHFSLSNFHDTMRSEIRKIKQKTDQAVLDVQNKVYIDTIKQLYREFALNAVATGNTSKDLFSDALLESFDDLILGYSNEVHNQGGVLAEPYGGKVKLERLYFIEDAIKDVPKTKAAFYAEEYKNGAKPIREMRAFANSLSTTELKNEEIVTALQYSKALSLANESRSFWWKFFHPIRNSAEKRVAREIDEKVSATLDILRENEQLDVQSNVWYNAKVTGAKANILQDAIHELQYNVSILEHDERSKAAAAKLAREGEKVVEVPEGKYLADKKLFAIGYRPNIENINQELREFEKLHNIIENGDDWETDGKKRFATRQIYSENYSRCIEIQGTLTSQGVEAAKATIEEKSNGWWATVDAQHNNAFNKHGEYRSSDIFLDKEPEPIQEENIVEQPIQEERVSIVVDLQEKAVQSSEEVKEEQSKSMVLGQK